MKSKLLPKINKYIFILILEAILFLPWSYFLELDNQEVLENLDKIQTYGEYAFRLTIFLLLLIDFNKEKMKYKALAPLTALLFPTLGVVIFSLLYLEKENKACA